jgi:hypothetical protein
MSSTAWYGTRLTGIVVAVALAALLALGARALLGHQTRVFAEVTPTKDVIAAVEPTETLIQPEAEAAEDLERERVLEIVPVPAVAAVPAKPPPAFLPPELQVLAQRIPEDLEKFEAATPVERMQQARELLSYSIAVIQCVQGTGPIPRGAPGDGDLSRAGKDGKWSFQLNMRTFHFDASEFPEYEEYLTLFSSLYDEEMRLLRKDTELPERLAQDIRLRAYEALGWL